MERSIDLEVETIMLATLVSLLPTRFKWLRRLRYVLLMGLMVRAWVMNQNRDSQKTQLEADSAYTTKRKNKRVDDPAGLTSL